MKRKLIYLIAMIFASTLMSGCLFSGGQKGVQPIEKQGYGTHPEEYKTVALGPSTIQQPDCNEGLKEEIRGLRGDIRSMFSRSQTQTQVVTQSTGQKIPMNLLKKPTSKPAAKSKAKPNLEKRVSSLEWQMREQSKTNWEHAKGILANGKDGNWRIEIIGYFLAGSSELKCSKKGCSLKKQIQNMIVDNERDGYVLKEVKGFTDNDGNPENLVISEKRAVNVHDHIVSLRKDYEEVKENVKGAGPTNMFGVAKYNRVVVCYWQKAGPTPSN